MVDGSHRWPRLSYSDWSDAALTLHLWTQVVGKIRLALTPWLNHSWHVPYYAFWLTLVSADRVLKLFRTGFIGKALDMDAGNLRRFIRCHAKAQAAQIAGRNAMGDVAEKKLFDLIEAGDRTAIMFYLASCQRGRGYGLPANSQLRRGDANTTNVAITSVNITPVPSGRFVEAPPKALEHAPTIIDHRESPDWPPAKE